MPTKKGLRRLCPPIIVYILLYIIFLTFCKCVVFNALIFRNVKSFLDISTVLIFFLSLHRLFET